jgi:hypothetical protein
MSTIEQKLAAMGLALPPPREFPSPNRRGAVRVGTILFLSLADTVEVSDLPLDRGEHGEGRDLGRFVALRLGHVQAELAVLAHVHAGMMRAVSRAPSMTRGTVAKSGVQLTMPNSRTTSDLFYELYGPQAGCHARSAVGMVNLPRGQAVEINGEFEIAP